MSLGLLLVPALGGFWFYTHWHRTKYDAARSSGYHVFFRSGFWGTLLFALALAIIIPLNHFFPATQDFWHTHFPVDYSDAAALAFTLGVVLPYLLNIFTDDNASAFRSSQNRGDLIELLITEAMEAERHIQVSLKTGRVYVGIPVNNPTRAEGETDLSLIPLASGHRDKGTQDLTLTTFYSDIIEQVMEERESFGHPGRTLEDFRVVVPIAEIVSVRLWEAEVYEAFQEMAAPGDAGDAEGEPDGEDRPSAGN